MHSMLVDLAYSELVNKVMLSLPCYGCDYFEFEDGSCAMHKLLLLRNHANNNSIMPWL